MLDSLDHGTPVVLPVAAVEQHGAHLPVNTDCLINEAICAQLDQSLGSKLLLLPTQQIGCSEHHMAFAGSLTVRHETFRRLVCDVAESVIRHGFRRLLILNSHGGNRAINGVIGEQIGQRFPDVDCLVANWWSVGQDRLEKMRDGPFGSTGHACEFETSIVLAVAPDLVDMTVAADDGRQHDAPQLQFDLLHDQRVTCYRSFDRLSRTGTFGMASLASAEKGHKILKATVESLTQLLRDVWSI